MEGLEEGWPSMQKEEAVLGGHRQAAQPALLQSNAWPGFIRDSAEVLATWESGGFTELEVWVSLRVLHCCVGMGLRKLGQAW